VNAISVIFMGKNVGQNFLPASHIRPVRHPEPKGAGPRTQA
jgi:hypothetical protein